jgi:hypothetical protein
MLSLAVAVRVRVLGVLMEGALEARVTVGGMVSAGAGVPPQAASRAMRVKVRVQLKKALAFIIFSPVLHTRSFPVTRR